jgi:hypothetical protein
MTSLEVLNSAPVGSVELQARVHFGVPVEFKDPKPSSWAPGKIYQIRRVKSGEFLRSPAAQVTIKMTLKYSVARYSIPNVVVAGNAAARDIVNAWWAAVDKNQVKDPNVVCLSRDPEMYEFQNEDGDTCYDIEDRMELFLIPIGRTCQEVVIVDVTWDGFDQDGLPLRLSISPEVHRETPCSRLLELWLNHYKADPRYMEVASHMFTDENEYYWKDHTGADTAPPLVPEQHVVFKMKPWLKENTAERQRKRPRPPPTDGRDPLRPALGQLGPAGSETATGTGPSPAEGEQSTQPANGASDRMNQYVCLRRSCPTRQVTVRVIVEDQTIELKVNPKIIIKDLLHITARTIGRDLPGWWHACVVNGTGDNQTYQEGDTIKLYPASEESIRRVNEPRTPKVQRP